MKKSPLDDEIIQIAEHYYIRATSSRADERTRVLKHGDTFGVFDRYGDVQPIGLGEHGVFHLGTRHLSRLELRLGKVRPVLLSSTVGDDNDVLTADLTNPDITENGDTTHIRLPRGVLHFLRNKFIWQGTCYERVQVSNHGMAPVRFSLALRFDADFVDIFEVRGSRRERRGTRLPPRLEPDGSVLLGYRGLDQVVRTTRFLFRPTPAELTEGTASWDLALPPQASETLYLEIACAGDHRPGNGANGTNGTRPRAPATDVGSAHQAAEAALAEAVITSRQQQASVETGNAQFNTWVRRSVSDLQMMITETEHGLYPYAGVPWFSTVFGRDGIITALQMLWLDPRVARGVLAYLAATQATAASSEQDAEPGKILHETRTGEMAALGEVPFGRYYGSVDSTPLFVMLAGAYLQRTGDLGFLRSIWSNLEAALRWMHTHGDPDGDGFVEYNRRSAHGLVQQGWKDSHDSVFHADGARAEPPIALCEVQGYVYAAHRAAAEVATALGDGARAEELRAHARRLRDQFEEAFWCDEIGTYALALDGRKRPCQVRSSNPGHCLYTGIATAGRGHRAARTLMGDASFSGWGVRTLATTEARYNPMSYHNGSVWPHDNALVAAGFSRYGLREETLRILEGQFLAATFLDLHRMPELFCGFARRRRGEAPTLYPVACLPQAWASGAVFMLLGACLGLSIDAEARVVKLENPVLPDWLPEVKLANLQVSDSATIDLLIERHPHDVSVTVLRRQGGIRVEVSK